MGRRDEDPDDEWFRGFILLLAIGLAFWSGTGLYHLAWDKPSLIKGVLSVEKK